MLEKSKNNELFMKTLKIAVSGAHSTGKTTFLNGLKKSIQSLGFQCSMVSDLASRCPLPILREHTIESTLWIVSTGIAEEIEAAYKANIVLVDRSLLDAWAYLMAIFSEPPEAKLSPKFKTLESTICNWLPTYTIIYQTQIDTTLPIQDNKGRDLDPDYRIKIERQMNLAFQNFNVQSRILSRDTSHEMELLTNYVRECFGG